ncbi:hypothetical protein L541_4424 [Bordetella hinzii CA90 BAL1384]|uniref:Uncharacterized protein n=1 Tax=Bordetella hinzii OH87 BAL007II TaxID=1331262 RepID=A0ABR4R1T9_9BORD|nr:hypothetical protein L544_2096 [Bordetella hinzii OH87 BAL007II]KCB32181.1 hypothetical protein L541_4424 [Bordetella hinzii CA90 BAL1384]KCB40567.1 hypothetical protein L539_2406 [Bordetella hinzii 5132]
MAIRKKPPDIPNFRRISGAPSFNKKFPTSRQALADGWMRLVSIGFFLSHFHSKKYLTADFHVIGFLFWYPQL